MPPMIYVRFRGTTVWHLGAKRSTVCGLGGVPTFSTVDVTRSTKVPPYWRVCKSCLHTKNAAIKDPA